MSKAILPVPCRTCGGMTTTGIEFCSPGCAEEYAAATKPCPDCGHVGWDCVCDDAYTVTDADATEQCEDEPCPNCGELDYPCRCGRDEMIEHELGDDEPADIDSDLDYDPYAGQYDDGRFDCEDVPW